MEKLASHLVFAFYCIIGLWPSLSIASSMGSVVCFVADIVTGQVAAGISTIGILLIGTGACFGKVSWPMAITVGAGIAGLFSAHQLASMWTYNYTTCS